jgi:hypothetical protein
MTSYKVDWVQKLKKEINEMSTEQLRLLLRWILLEYMHRCFTQDEK